MSLLDRSLRSVSEIVPVLEKCAYPHAAARKMNKPEMFLTTARSLAFSILLRLWFGTRYSLPFPTSSFETMLRRPDTSRFDSPAG